MKKVLFAVMAMVAIGFTSCSNKAKAPADGAESEVTVSADDEAAATINALTEQIDAKDATKFQEVLATVKEKVLEIISKNPEVAKEYVTKVQDFLKENSDKIKRQRDHQHGYHCPDRRSCRCRRQWVHLCRGGYQQCR